MTNHTCPIHLTNEFLAEAAPILDDSTDYPADGPDRYMVAMSTVVTKIAAAGYAADWSVTIDVTAAEAAILREEAEYRLTFDIDARTRRELERLVDRLKVISVDLAEAREVLAS